VKILAVKCPQVAVVFGKCGREVLLPPGNTAIGVLGQKEFNIKVPVCIKDKYLV
jgi:hypothetical protein